ncbi:MAG: hypothetical protein KBS35_00025 [Mycoplasma sp.]|nr:hypothetical protein [Candidatus Hennigella equi]
MTRMQKWADYRKEIYQASKIGFTIDQQTQQIANYKKVIDKINPAILQNVVEPDLDLHKGVSEVIVSQNQVPEHITKLFKNLNKAKTINNRNNISTILFNLKNDNILDENDNLKEEWLKTNPDYAKLSDFIKQTNLSLGNDKEFEKDLEAKFKNLSGKKKQTQVGEIISLSKNNQKNVGHHVFVISISIASVFFLLTFVLLIVRWLIL